VEAEPAEHLPVAIAELLGERDGAVGFFDHDPLLVDAAETLAFDQLAGEPVAGQPGTAGGDAPAAGAQFFQLAVGPFQLTALGVGAIIGAGIFVLSGLGAHYAGPGLMLSFVVSGLGCA